MMMPGRRYDIGTSYRYGFNGKENDNDVKGEGSQQDYGKRIYDPRLGRFLSVDPLTKKYPKLTPYQFASNRPTLMIDLDGMEGSMGISGSATVAPQGHSMIEFDSDGDWIPDYGKGWAGGALFTFEAGASLLGGRALAGNFWAILPELVYNPVVQTEIIGGLAALAGYQGPDIPSVGSAVDQTFTRTWQEVKIVKQGGKEVSREILGTAELIMHEGSSFATQAEKKMAQKLLSEGKTVEVLAESKQQGVRTADYVIDGVQTELKTISDIKKIDADHLSNSIAQTLKRSKGQGGSIIIDVTNQQGASREVVERALKRYWKQNKSVNDVRVIGNGYEQQYSRSQFYSPSNN
jgi:RHS repeat-associated protein